MLNKDINVQPSVNAMHASVKSGMATPAVRTKMEYGVGIRHIIRTRIGIGMYWVGATSGIIGEPGTLGNKVGIDAALKKDIDFVAIRKETEEKAREYYQKVVTKCGGSIPKLELFWETIFGGETFTHLSIDEKRILYHSQDAVKCWKEAGFENGLLGPQIDDFQCTETEFVNRNLLNTFVPYAFLKDGTWHESANMGWWGISSNEIPKEEWQNKVWEMLTALPDDTLISFYDCHI